MFGRKAALQLLALIVVGAVIAYVLRAQAPVGENVGDRGIVQAVRLDRSSPVAEVAGADVTIIAFTDYQCPACRKAHGAMARAVLEDGRTRIVYKDWPIFGKESERAAQVAIASSFQGIYSAVHDALMKSENLGDEQLKVAVENAGGSWSRIQADLAGRGAAIQAQLDRNRRQAFGLGLGGTPGYLIGPILVRGAISERQFRRAIGEARQAS
ncbi:MAG: thioredoxin domain-containing protein [Novosphingobium sp.]|nr:thioredoxin domain-containing protein [Novosphingobium sp.]